LYYIQITAAVTRGTGMCASSEALVLLKKCPTLYSHNTLSRP